VGATVAQQEGQKCNPTGWRGSQRVKDVAGVYILSVF